MRLTPALSALLFFSMPLSYAQDIITTKDHKQIEANVLKVNPTEIVFKKTSNPAGPEYSLPLDEIIEIEYWNGELEDLARKAEVLPLNAKGEVKQGMSFGQYKKLYSHKDYIHEAPDPYSRAWAGISSALVPGLGQVICGRPIRGLAFFGGAAALTAAGLCFADCDTVAKDESGGKVLEIGLNEVVLGFFAAALAVDIWSVCDAVKVARIRNMYIQDMRTLKYTDPTFDLRLSPFLSSPVTPASGPGPVAGLSLRMRF